MTHHFVRFGLVQCELGRTMRKPRLRIPQEDVYQRINYLYQAAYESLKQSDVSLCRFYIYTLRTISRRSCLHLYDHEKREKHSVVTCLECGTVRRYVYKAAKIPWIDKADAWEDKIIFGKPVKDDSKGMEQQNKKGQGKGKNNKQGSSKTSKEKSESTEHSGKATNQWDLGNKIREPNKVDLNTGSSDIRNCQTLDCKSACKKRQLDGEISIIGNKTDFKKHCELGKLSEKFNSAAQKTTNSSIDEESYLAHCSGTSVKTDMESSQNPAEAVEETEQRPDEYLYKMTFVHGFYPYLG